MLQAFDQQFLAWFVECSSKKIGLLDAVLIIDECIQCPHSKSVPIQMSDNQYTMYCNHPDLDEPKSWVTKISNIVTPPPMCPLPTYTEPDMYYIKRNENS